ncbi:hypothetical protein DRE_05211 [Drechslerella stenobrocha 248]|uniref:RING-type domain-containing protein n=1 Tax=Drechslerella stenobrocha 248 TaxID=1043628 RepID=W7I9D1_9PEZI|nr:hypothetical protein DRE_05211 [Drechslerella stenobrocha 248]
MLAIKRMLVIEPAAGPEADTELLDVPGMEQSSDDMAIDSPATPTPASRRRRSSTGRATGNSRKTIPRKNAKRTPKKQLPAILSQSQDSQDSDPVTALLTAHEKKQLKKQAEEKGMGERIKLLAATVGWTHPCRANNNQASKKGIPYRYKEERPVPCAICGEKVPVSELSRLHCRDRHCHSCLRQNFQMVIKDPSAWPAKCCMPLDHNLAADVLTKDEFTQFLEVKYLKEQMSSTYCYSCDGRVPTANIMVNSAAYCAACDKLTCIHCAKPLHEGPCLIDPETEKLFEVAQGNKWSKCPRCSNMVERNTGCNSIMCRCGVNFCYRCGRETMECNKSGLCEQIEFQPGMLKDQGSHRPVKSESALVEQYRGWSQARAAGLASARSTMINRNSEALKRHEAVTEILSLRARLQKKSPKKNDATPKSNTDTASTVSPTPTPATPVKTESPAVNQSQSHGLLPLKNLSGMVIKGQASSMTQLNAWPAVPGLETFDFDSFLDPSESFGFGLLG